MLDMEAALVVVLAEEADLVLEAPKPVLTALA